MADPWAKRRSELYGLLGDLPDRHRPVSGRVVDERAREHYTVQTLTLDLNGIEPVPAYLVFPHGGGPHPIVVYNHAHGGNYELGKDELIHGRGALQDPPYAEALARRGYASICIDTWAFGERRGRTESEIFKEMLWKGQVLWGMMVYDSLRAVDYVSGLHEIDSERIGTLGISMGSTMAWWLAALDERIRCCVDLCCLTDFASLIAARGLDGHGIYYYVPSLLKHFDTAGINELIAPRAHLAIAGKYDPLTPPDGLAAVDTALTARYRELGAPEAWKLLVYHTGHFETHDMRAEVLQFLERWL